MNNQSDVNTILRTLNFAAIAHRDQRRKGLSQVPYINHLIEVAYLMTDVAKVEDCELIQAALLHDVLEDTPVTEEDLHAQFNTRVVELVKTVSDDKKMSLKERRQQQIEHLKHAAIEARLIKLADICSNILSVPESWNKERKQSYIDWIEQVADLCTVASTPLAQEYIRRLKEAKNLV